MQLQTPVRLTSRSFQDALRENADAIAQSIVLEQGKTMTDAHGDLHRGIQVVQAATAMTSTLLGNKLEGMPLALSLARTR